MEWQVAPSFLSYHWSTGSTAPSIIITQPGDYALTVTDANGCTTTTTQLVEPAPVPNPTIPTLPASCNGNSQQLTVEGGPFLAYNWSTGANTSSINVTQPGTYIVTVTNQRGCSASASATVSVGTAPTASISTAGSGCTGNATLTATGGTTYLWSTGETTATISITNNGNYLVTVTNAGGCTATASAAVNTSAPPTLSISGPTNVCAGNLVTLTANSGFASYIWSNGGTGPSISTDQPGSYSVTATDAQGCTATVTASLLVNPAPQATITGPASLCTGSSGHLVVSGDFSTCIWTTGSVSQNIIVTQPGNYTVTVTNAQGCTMSASQTLSVGSSLAVSIGQTVSGCLGTASLDAGVGYANYLWSTGANTPSITVTQPGGYAVTVSDASGCTGESNSSVAFSPPPSASIIGPSSVCLGGAATLTASSGFNAYHWNTGENTSNISPIQSGNYAVTVTDAAGCTATASQLFTILAAPTVSISGPISVCTGQNANLVASGSFAQALWSTGGTANAITVSQPGQYSVTVTSTNGCTASTGQQFSILASPSLILDGPSSICIGNTADYTLSGDFIQTLWSTSETSNTITVSQPGTYAVTVTGANGCTASTAQPLTVSSSLSPTISPILLPCSTSATLVAGTGYGSYLWSNGGASSSIIAVQSGSYSVTVSDVGGCTGEAQINLSFPAMPSVQILGTTSICMGSNATFGLSGSFPQVLWSTGETTPSISTSQPGIYTVTITDDNGCSASTSQTLTVGTLLLPQITTVNPSCNGTATLNAGPGYDSYFWSNGATSPTINISQAGTYSVSVSNAGGCSGEAAQAVSFPALPQVQVTGPLSFCENTTAQLTVNGSFPSVNWSTGSTAASIQVSQPGSYSVTVADANGCTATASQSISYDPAPLPAVSATNVGCDGTGTLATGNGFASYIWSNGATTPSIGITQSGNYSVTVTNVSGCSGSGQLAVNLPTPPQVSISGNSQFCEGYSETLSVPSNFVGYQWSTGSILSQITITSGGLYGITVTDGNGCTATAAWAVTMLPTQYSFVENHSCNLQDTGTVMTNLTSQSGCDSVVTVTTVLEPTLTASLALSACPGETAVFNGIHILAGNTQDFVLTNSAGCDSVLSVMVEELPAVSLDWEASPSCWNVPDGSVTVTASGGTPPFSFAMDGDMSNTSSIFTGLAAGNYQVEVFDQNGCSVEMPVEVAAFPRTTILLEDAELGCGDGAAVLRPEILSGDAGRVAWHWSNGVETQDLQVTTAGRYHLTADDGCEVQTVSATVLPSAEWDRGYFYVPNSFSPDGDGINDYFMPSQNPNIEVRLFEFRVFDRWGNSIFSSSDPSDRGWDGLYRQVEMQNAVFVWFLKATVADCLGEDMSLFLEGGVNVMR